jgi:hypothetical protein
VGAQKNALLRPVDFGYTAAMVRAALLGFMLAGLACGGIDSAAGGGDGTVGDDGSGGDAMAADTATSSAMTTTADSGADETGGRHHPVGFADSQVHGLAAKLAVEDCRDCHGTDLAGGEALSCDSCHHAGWRTECVYCHGGEESSLGAPPRDLDPSLGVLSFAAHSAHATESNHAAFDCTACHAKPNDVLSPGHLFDGTPAVAETDFTHGLSPQGLFSAGTCGNLYCHGNGNGTLGAMIDGDPSPACGGCHAYTGSPANSIGTMSGEHSRHINEGIGCEECHAATVDAAGGIIQPLLHVNGLPEVVTPNVSYSGGACTGLCHVKAHFAEHW